MKTVTITYCYGDKADLISTHRTDCDEIAIGRAIDKHFGKRATWHQDNGLSNQYARYGQIGHYIGQGCYSMDTGRVRIEVE